MGPRGRFDFLSAFLRRTLGTRRGQIWAASALSVVLLAAIVTMSGATSLGMRTAAAVTPSVASPTPAPNLPTACPAGTCPQQGPRTGDPVLDNIWYGAIPPGSNSKPVLVFLHGIAGIASDWWTSDSISGTNDMYLLAYTAGYRTAFVTINASGQRGPGNTMWVNGPKFAKQVAYIAQYYGVEKVDVVTHSKGGVDAQTAIVFDGAARYVNEVFTLSSPNLGSPVADIACATGPPPPPLSAVCAMTPAYMAIYRQITDPKSMTQGITYHQAGGTYIGQAPSVLWLAGTYMNLLGDTNDGFVPISSSLGLTYEPQLFIRQYDHDSMRIGHNVFPWIQAWLTGGTTLTPVVPSTASQQSSVSGGAPAQVQPLAPLTQGTQIFRSGKLSGTTSVIIPVEAGVVGVDFSVITSDQSSTVSLVDPNGQDQPFTSQILSNSDVYSGYWFRSFQATSPTAGQWKVSLSGPAGATYQVIASFASPLQVSISGIPFPTAAPGQSFTPQATVSDPGGSTSATNITYRITSVAHGTTAPLSTVDQSGAVQLPSQPDLVSIRFTVTGQTSSGSPFERSFVRTLPVLSDPQQLIGLGSAP